MIKSICVGIGLNMFFPEFVDIVDAAPTVKELFFKPGFNKDSNKSFNSVNKKVNFNRTQNK